MDFGTEGAERRGFLNSETPKKPMEGAARPTGCKGETGRAYSMRSRDWPGLDGAATKPGRRQESFRLPTDIEFSGERKRVRCNEGLDNRKASRNERAGGVKEAESI